MCSFLYQLSICVAGIFGIEFMHRDILSLFHQNLGVREMCGRLRSTQDISETVYVKKTLIFY